MEHAKLLTRDEMKNIKAGDGYCGNIYCSLGGVQYFCASGDCEYENGNQVIFDLCLSGCIDLSTEEASCDGCAQFPVMEG